MPTPGHEAYRKSVRDACCERAHDADFVATLVRHAAAVLVLWYLDLEPARPILQRCYAPSPRGGQPRDPVVMLRCLLLAILVGQPSLNKWAADLKGSRVLRILAGLGDDPPPGVGTFYDFLHRLHDGPARKSCEHVVAPSEAERRRARTPRNPKRRPKKAAKGKQKHARGPRNARRGRRPDDGTPQAEPDTRAATDRLVAQLEQADRLDNPRDLLTRLGEILVEVALVESAQKGLLGDLGAIVAGGDGSPLRTGANRHGKRVCDHGRFDRCDCAKRYTDPDAEWGWDSHRNVWFFGHHFYEVSCSTGGHDLPLALWLDPGDGSDYTASVRALDRLRKTLRTREITDGWRLSHFIADSGHDAEAIHRYLVGLGIKPVIPLKTAARATHPTRADVQLSERGVPLCQAGVEMAHWGTAGKGRTSFLCPVKANKLATCPLAPSEQPDWHCRPDLKWGPTTVVAVDDNPRLFPAIPRHTATYERLYNLRSGTERSNAVKKETFGLEAARHRRGSFWLTRLHLIAILQHAKAWVAQEDAGALVDHLLGKSELAQAA